MPIHWGTLAPMLGGGKPAGRSELAPEEFATESAILAPDVRVVVLPPGLAAEIIADAREQERQEEFVAAQVAAGAELDGLYPLGDRWREAYQAWLAERES